MRELLRYLYHDEKLVGKEIAEIFNMGQSTIGRWMKKYGIKARPAGWVRKIYWDRDWFLNQHYNLNKTIKQMARENNVRPSTIGFWMKKNGVKARYPTLENNPNWKGGRGVRSDGYITIRTKNGDELEHRFIMEKHLNRKLKRAEIVHHLDGDRANNNIENLEVTSLKEHSALGYTSGYNQGFIDCALNILAHVV